MAQTNLMSDNYCSYNQESAEFFWTFQPDQYNNKFVIGEVGVIPSGGSAGSYVPSNSIDVSSFLQNRSTILSKCNPPIPSLDSLNRDNFDQMKKSGQFYQEQSNSMSDSPSTTITNQSYDTNILLQKYTKEKKSQAALDSVDYNRFDPGLKTNAQNLRNVIEDLAASRNGLDTRNYTKSAWSNQNNSPNYDSSLCRTTLDPSRDCGPFCSPVNGQDRLFLAAGKPQPEYPFTDITSQQAFAVGSIGSGPQFFSGIQFDQGQSPPIRQQVFKQNPYLLS